MMKKQTALTFFSILALLVVLNLAFSTSKGDPKVNTNETTELAAADSTQEIFEEDEGKAMQGIVPNNR